VSIFGKKEFRYPVRLRRGDSLVGIFCDREWIVGSICTTITLQKNWFLVQRVEEIHELPLLFGDRYYFLGF